MESGQTAPFPSSSFLASAREAVLLERAMRTARAYPDAARPRLIALARAGREAALVADRALEDGYLASAYAVYREAALLFMAADVIGASAAEELTEPLSSETVLARFRDRPRRASSTWPPGGRAAVDAFCAAIDASLDRAQPVGQVPARAQVESARDVVHWLGTLIEPRGLAELRFERGVRVGIAGILAVAVLAWAVSSLADRNNVALHKPVTTSGLHPAATAAPNGLTDGEISGAPYGVHTQVGDSPWVQVDLGRVYSLDKIKIYNRGDGFFDDGLPMTLQLSQDGASFTDVETRTKIFGQRSPWVANVAGRPARYVRVRGAKGKYVTLSELEAYAQ